MFSSEYHIPQLKGVNQKKLGLRLIFSPLIEIKASYLALIWYLITTSHRGGSRILSGGFTTNFQKIIYCELSQITVKTLFWQIYLRYIQIFWKNRPKLFRHFLELNVHPKITIFWRALPLKISNFGSVSRNWISQNNTRGVSSHQIWA